MIQHRLVSFLLILFFILSNTALAGHEDYLPSQELQGRWMVYEGDQFRPFSEKDNGNVSTIYVLLDEHEYNGKKIIIESPFQFAVFINGQLTMMRRKDAQLDVDSVRASFRSGFLTIGIYQEKIHQKSLLVYPNDTDGQTASKNNDPELKPTGYFRDFVLVSSLILLGLLVMIARLNPKLTADYFSVNRIFSLRESDDSQLNSRITSSSNILFYSYCSLIISFYLMIIFHFVAGSFQSAWAFQAESFGEAFLQWLKLSVTLLMIFFIKIILIYLFTRLFALNDIFGLHVFNWIRLMLIFFGVLSVFLIVYHIVRGQSEEIYANFMWALVWVLGLWVLIVFPKVMHRTGYSLFHIFSYICATEIIPLLISIKIIYY